ncbi:hypothetical protein HELRODRAFT_177999 [Helobdella robusta]|uniref:Endonuclease/exonuclease/phosphatase domain-containing protein n=1 Tax=Helobdella robusta TaxID=6412 RepID=T1FCL0_HELRO|nr:hypothetical protein HELRODRAFT_177999 [Helobdella robusta]ESN97564.1 hypothetical protein HELRODRAFT_177999 [Helobdella robusta]
MVARSLLHCRKNANNTMVVQKKYAHTGSDVARVNKTGAYALMKKELERFRYDVVGLCEVRWTGGGEMEGGKILWSGTEREHVYGVGMDVEIEAFYDQLEQTLNVLPKKDVKIITGDWNAKIGRDNIGFEEVMGKYGIGKRNNRGERLLEFAKDQKMYITNTKTQKHKIQKNGHGNHQMEKQRT